MVSPSFAGRVMKRALSALVLLLSAGPAFGWDTNNWQFLETIERANLRFFQQEKHGPYSLLNDTAFYDSTNNFPAYSSVAGTGFELTAICLGHYRGWISYSNAYGQVLYMLRAFDNRLSNDPDVFKKINGWTFHAYTIYGTNAGKQFDLGDGLSLLDHSLLMGGVIFAGEYFKGTEAGMLAQKIYADTTWSWRPNNDYNFGYSENLLAVVESAEAPQFKKGTEARVIWESLVEPYPRTLQLYFWQYPHAWIDFRNRWDGLGRNHQQIAMDSILYQRQRAIDLHNADPVKYDMIGSNCWGWTAAGASDGYRQAAPWPLWLGSYLDEEQASDSGSIMPIGLPGCMVYAGTETMACMKNIFEKYYINGWNPGVGERPVWSDTYGWLNCLNKGRPWRYYSDSGVSNHFHPINAGIDYGPNVLLLENYKMGSTWRWFMQNTNISAGMTTLGFGATQQVYEATFAGSSNDFGCGLGSWNNDATTVSVAYVDADVTNAFVGDKVVRILADSSNEGGWIDVCTRDMRAKASLSFWLKGLTGAETIDVGLKDVFGLENKVNLADFVGGPTPTNWTLVQIPLERFCLTGNVTNDVWPGSLSLVSFAFTDPSGGGLFIDRLGFTRDTLAPALPTNGFGVAMAGRHARVRWNPDQAERDVVGYDVHRRYNATSGFARTTSLLVPAYHGVYEDTSIVVGVDQPMRYAIQAWDNGEPQNGSPYSLEKIAYGGRLDIDWNNGQNPNVLGGSGDGYWGPVTSQWFGFVYTNAPDGSFRWARRSMEASPGSGHFIDLAGGDAGDYWALQLEVRGAAGGEQLLIGLKDSATNETKVDLDGYLASGVSTGWSRAIIPLSDFTNINVTSLDSLTFTHEASNDVLLAGLCFLWGQRPALVGGNETEAERWTRQFGTTTQDLKSAASAGEVLGWGWGLNGGHYADYEFYVSRAMSNPVLHVRYACFAGDGRTLDVRWDDQTQGTLSLTNTGGWGELSNDFSWASVALPAITAGQHKLTFYASSFDVPANLDVWHFTDANSAFRECEAFSAMAGSTGVDAKAGASASVVLGNSWGVATNSEASYAGVDAGAQTGAWFHLWYALGYGSGRTVDVLVDGSWRARLVCPRTSGWGERSGHFGRASVFVGPLAAGPHIIRLVAAAGDAINLDCFYIGGESPDALAYDGDGDGLSDREEAVVGSSASQADSDGDGIGDADELTALVTGQISDPARVDSDGDGGSDFQEWVAGTDPWGPSSVFGVDVVENMTNLWRLTWPAVTLRQYRVYYADGSFSNGMNFQEISDPENILIQGSTGLYQQTSGSASRYFRLGVQKP